MNTNEHTDTPTLPSAVSADTEKAPVEDTAEVLSSTSVENNIQIRSPRLEQNGQSRRLRRQHSRREVVCGGCGQGSQKGRKPFRKIEAYFHEDCLDILLRMMSAPLPQMKTDENEIS